MSRVFGHGDLRLYLLKLLEEGPKHGYELIRLLEDRFLGMYSPSPGTVYPRLSALEEDGLVTSEEVEGRKVYRLTDAGRREVDARREEVEQVGKRVSASARDLARQIRDEVRSSVRDLRQDMREAPTGPGRDAAREAREAARLARDPLRNLGRNIGAEVRRVVRDVQREERRAAREVGQDLRGSLRTLQRDLEAFVTDVIAAARRHRLDADRMTDLREALLEAREQIIEALAGRRKR